MASATSEIFDAFRSRFMIGASTAVTLEESVRRCQSMHDAAKRVKPDILVLCHGGPIAEPEDAQYILDHTEGIVGFYGASSMERLPVVSASAGAKERDRCMETCLKTRAAWAY